VVWDVGAGHFLCEDTLDGKLRNESLEHIDGSDNRASVWTIVTGYFNLWWENIFDFGVSHS